MEVKVFDKVNKCYNWVAVKCSDGRVYEYSTEEEALKMLKICYPEQTRFNDFTKARIKKQEQ